MILQLVMAVFATAAIAVTVTRASILQRPRNWIEQRNAFLGKLFTCPYCFAHWVALGFAFFVDASVFEERWLDIVTLTFALTSAASIVAGVMFRTLLDQEAYIQHLKSLLVETKAALREIVQ